MRVAQCARASCSRATAKPAVTVFLSGGILLPPSSAADPRLRDGVWHVMYQLAHIQLYECRCGEQFRTLAALEAHGRGELVSAVK